MKKLNYLFSFMSMLILVMACNTDEFLEPTPFGKAGDATFFRNGDDAVLAVNAAYRNLRARYDGFNGDYGWGNIGTDDAWKGGSDAADQADLAQKENYTLLPSVGGITQRWGQCFSGITSANKVLQNVPEIEDMDDALKARVIGEAHFLRAVYYMDLAKWFGGAPIYGENLPNLTDYTEIPKNTEAEVWAFVEEELLKALAVLPKKSEYADGDIGRATKGAALGFLMRANALQKNMPKVKEYGEQLFALGEYSLAPTYLEIWQSTGENGPGSIFEVQFAEADQGWNNGALGSTTATAYGPRQQEEGVAYGGWGFTQARQELLDEFEDDDPRFEHSFIPLDGQEYAPLDGENSFFGRKVAYTPYTDYSVPAAPVDGAVNWRVLRLADAYLMYAEAVYQSSPQVAMDYVNLVRERAREGNDTILPDIEGLSGAPLLDAIYRERRVELNLEGHRFHDLIRTDRTNIMVPYGFKAGVHERMPIPQEEIDNYGGVLEQNPGY